MHLIFDTILPKKQRNRKQGRKGPDRLGQRVQHNTPCLRYEVRPTCWKNQRQCIKDQRILPGHLRDSHSRLLS